MSTNVALDSNWTMVSISTNGIILRLLEVCSSYSGTAISSVITRVPVTVSLQYKLSFDLRFSGYYSIFSVLSASQGFTS